MKPKDVWDDCVELCERYTRLDFDHSFDDGDMGWPPYRKCRKSWELTIKYWTSEETVGGNWLFGDGGGSVRYSDHAFKQLQPETQEILMETEKEMEKAMKRVIKRVGGKYESK